MKKEEIVDNLTIVLDLITTIVKKETREISLDLNASQICVLKLIDSNQGIMKVQDIINYLKKRKSTVTEILNKLEEKGYIVKCPCSLDKREIYVKSTEKFKEHKNKIDYIATKVVNDIYYQFADEDKEKLNEFLEKIEKNLKR